jgi:hypothetical protein
MHTRHALLLCVLAPALTLSAAAPAPIYQDGILTKIRTTVPSNACSSSTQSDAATYGNTARRTFDASARCSDIQGAIYTVQVGAREYELTPDHSRVARVSAQLPLSATFLRQSSLANHQPGTAVKLRSEDNTYFVLVGKHESQYHLFNPGSLSQAH